MSTAPQVPAAKEALRRRVRVARALRAPDADLSVARAIADHVAQVPQARDVGPGQVVAAYASFGAEPPTVLLLETLRARGVVVVLPRLGVDGILEWVDYSGPDSLVPQGHLAIPTPAGPTLGRGAAGLGSLGVQAMVIPALAAGNDGRRCGRGAGWYDRALDGLVEYAAGGPIRICLVYDDELLGPGEVPIEPHDALVDVVVTPSRWLRCEGSAEGRG